MRKRCWDRLLRAWRWRVEISPTPGLVFAAGWFTLLHWLTPAATRTVQAVLLVPIAVGIVALVALAAARRRR